VNLPRGVGAGGFGACIGAVAAVVAAVAPATAHANLIAGTSDDLRTVFIESDERLLPEDTDSFYDVYVNRGDTLTLATDDPGVDEDVDLIRNSPDGLGFVFVVDHDRALYRWSESAGIEPVPGYSEGSLDYNGGFLATDDLESVFFPSSDQLVAQDLDFREDLYRLRDGELTLVSPGSESVEQPQLNNWRFFIEGFSPDGDTVVFQTFQRLAATDTNDALDIYRWRDDEVVHISRPAPGLSSAAGNSGRTSISDAQTTLFTSEQPLSPDDNDELLDAYTFGDDGYELVSVPEEHPDGTSADAYSLQITEDGSRRFFRTTARMTADDLDEASDIYVREGDTTRLVTPGAASSDENSPPFDVRYRGSSPDGDAVVFETREPLLPSDENASEDFYVVTLSGDLARVTDNYGPYVPISVRHINEDGHLIVSTSERLAQTDRDDTRDLYRWAHGEITHLSTGPLDESGDHWTGAAEVTRDGSRVAFLTSETLVDEDVHPNRPNGRDSDLHFNEAGVNTIVQLDRRAPVARVGLPADGLTLKDLTPVSYGIADEFDFFDADAIKYECRWDDEEFGECVNFGPFAMYDDVYLRGLHQRIEPLTPGRHTFSMRVTDRAGNRGVTTNSVELTGPDVPSPSAGFNPTPNDVIGPNNSGILQFDSNGVLYCSIDGEPAKRCQETSPGGLADLRSLKEGPHSLRVWVWGDAGLSMTPLVWRGTMDRTRPTIELTSTPESTEDSRDATFRFSSDEAGLEYQCMLVPSRGAYHFQPCTSPVKYENLEPGEHYFAVRAFDSARNVSSEERFRWKIRRRPAVTFTQGPSEGETISSRESTFAWESDMQDVSFECSIDSGPFTSCEPPLAINDLAEGDHTLAVVGESPEGAVGPPAEAAWRVDTVAPETRFISPPRRVVLGRTVRIPFEADESGVTFKCRLDGASFEPCRSPSRLRELARGPHSLEVLATDSAGNVEESAAVHNFRVVRRAPRV
jgi:hypothetical protein